MAILALEPDPARAATIRHIVCDLVRADLKLVRSKNELLQALDTCLPDLILLPALLSPADDSELLTHLSALKGSGHLELLVIPFLFADDPPVVAPRGWRRWWERGRSRPHPHACHPAAFAEQILWSLGRGHEDLQEQARCGQLQAEPGDAGTADPLLTPYSNRRASMRFQADELQGIRTARIKHGPLVRLVDCSAGGALLETAVPLRPESEALLELVGEAGDVTVPFRVLRCHAAPGQNRLLYWGACAFTRPLELDDLRRSRQGARATSMIDRRERVDIAVKTIVERYLSLAVGRAGALHTFGGRDMAELVASLQELSRLPSFDPGSHAIEDLLTVVTAALRHGEDGAVTPSLIETHLHLALPWLTVRLAAAPATITTAGKEAFYLRVPAADGAGSPVLNVELPQGSILEAWQFRLLQAGAYLAALIPAPSDAGASRPTTDGRDRRRHVRVSGRFDGRLLGGISMPLMIRDLSIGGCFVESFDEQQEGRRLTIEVHFPNEGLITLEIEVVCSRPGFGFAVRFVEMSEHTRACLARVVAEAVLRDIGDGSVDPQFAQSMIA